MQHNSGTFSRETVEGIRARLVEAVVVSTPLLAFLAFYRLTTDLRYVTYSIPVLGEMPKPVLFDLSVFAVATAVWLAARLTLMTRMIYLALAIPIGASQRYCGWMNDGHWRWVGVIKSAIGSALRRRNT